MSNRTIEVVPPTETLGIAQILMLQDIMSIDSSPDATATMSGTDVVIAVAAQYEYEQQTAASIPALDAAEPANLAAAQKAHQAASHEGRRAALRDEQLGYNTPAPIESPSLSDLMEADALRHIRDEIQREYRTAIERRVDERVGSMALAVTVEQARWELEHGMAFRLKLRESETDPERQDEITRMILSEWRSASKAFASNDSQPLSPQQLTDRMKLPPGIASPVISGMVVAGALTRDVQANTLSPTALTAPSRLRRFIDRNLYRLTRGATSEAA